MENTTLLYLLRQLKAVVILRLFQSSNNSKLIGVVTGPRARAVQKKLKRICIA